MTAHVLLCGPADPAQFFPGVSDLPEGHSRIPVLSTLAHGLIRSGYRVSAVSLSMNVEDRWTYSDGDLDLTLVPQRTRARSRALDGFRAERVQLAEEVRRSAGASIIHAHWTYEYAWAAMNDPRPTVTTIHDAPLTVLKTYKDAYRFLRWLLAWRVRLGLSTVSAVSPYLASRWRSEMRWVGDVPVIPNISPWPSEPRQVVRGTKVVSIGNADPRKNIASLVRAMPAILGRHPEASLVLIGPGLSRDGRFARDFGDLGGRIQWLGDTSRERVRQELRTARLAVHPSLEESQGIVLLEAMSQGVPVVAGHRSGAVGWTLGDAGHLVNVRDPQAIADGVSAVLHSPDWQLRMSQSGLSRVEGEFGERTVVEQYLALYRAVLQKEPGQWQ